MRTLRLSLAGTVIVVLLAGSGGAALAQSESDEAMRVTPVTGKLIEQVMDDSQLEFTSEDGVNTGRGMRFVETYEWSDPRLPSVKTTVLNFNSYPGGDAGRGVMSQTTNRLDGPTGSWVGTATAMQYPDLRGIGQDIYIGEGAYEGHVAVLICDTEGCEGMIFEGELPPMPDPVEPPAE
jgi:hypothetical protein